MPKVIKAHEAIKELIKEARNLYSFTSYVGGSLKDKEDELKNINRLIALIERIKRTKSVLASIGIHSSIDVSIGDWSKKVDTYIRIWIEDDFSILIKMNDNMSGRVAKRGTNTLHSVLSVLKQRKKVIEASIARLNSFINI